MQLQRTPAAVTRCSPLLRRASVRVACSLTRLPQCLSPTSNRRQQLHDASLDLGPYLLWDKALQLRALWDARAHCKADLQRLGDVLQGNGLQHITISSLEGARGQQLTALTLVCSKEQCDEAAAALLKWTPATHISATECEQCYLPQQKVSVDTAHGPVTLSLALAGSRVCKVTPDWQQCQEVAAAAASPAEDAAAGGRVDAAVVAAAAVQQLHAGLEDGSIDLGMADLY